MIDLPAFLRAKAGSPFVWGQDDCCLVLADYWHHVHGVDPAHWLRGAYSTRDECRAVVAAHRGLQRLVSLVASHAGAVLTRAPDACDFGLIALNGQPFGAICAGHGMWAIRSEEGVGFVTSPRILRAWSINDVGCNLAPEGPA